MSIVDSLVLRDQIKIQNITMLYMQQENLKKLDLPELITKYEEVEKLVEKHFDKQTS